MKTMKSAIANLLEDVEEAWAQSKGPVDCWAAIQKVLDAFADEWEDLVPLPGGKYAIPKERLEAAVEKMAELSSVDGTQLTEQEMLRHYRAIYEREVLVVLTAALGGAVYPVEAVGRVRPSPKDADVYLFPSVDEDITGRTVAIIAEEEA